MMSALRSRLLILAFAVAFLVVNTSGQDTSKISPPTQYGMRDWITEEAHLMVFEEMP